ncbi:MAG: tannase/feruloyl esterase family alpha/beta hydrolase [Pseudomonadales bacterium]|nr:tannase/feruloyl esterase family alpha/beta hydrolase [Pseudomonadales bacterium]
MTKTFSRPLFGLGLLLLAGNAAQAQSAAEEQACQVLAATPNLTILSASIMPAQGDTPAYCYVRGLIAPSTHYHVQLPLPGNWNARFLQWGDGGKDGDLDFANHRLAQGYAVANSNTGHDSATEPGSQFGYHNRQAEIDFGYRSVHLTVMAGKALAQRYYRTEPSYSYFEGCSTGGRQGLMEAQRFPYDFDGIVAGAPVNYYQAMNAAGVWWLQRMFKDDFAGNLAVDTDADGSFDSVNLLQILNQQVLQKCDAQDGIRDGLLNNPLACEFEPQRDLAALMCTNSSASDSCFTPAQVQTIADFYSGPYDDAGTILYPGKALGSELEWINLYVPNARNRNAPGMLVGPAGDHVNYLFYENDPGVAIADLSNPAHVPGRNAALPEFSWLEFDINDLSAGKATLMQSIMDATDPDLSRFLKDNKGKLLLYHGWSDALSSAKATVRYFEDMVTATYNGQMSAAMDSTRLFLAPGMGHCGGGPGPNTWDKLPALVDWVENDRAPANIIATHASNGRVDNERPLCPYPQEAVYTGPSGGEDAAENWVAENFTCR